MDWNQIPLGLLTPGMLILAVAWLVFTGRLVPRVTHEEQLADLRTERDRWRTAAEESTRQVTALLPAAQASTSFIEATMKAAMHQVERRQEDPPT